MSSGDSLLIFTPQTFCGPGGTTTAQFDTLLGTSSPAENVPVLAFDQTTVEYADFHAVMPLRYGGGGVTVAIISSAAATTGGLAWEIAFRRVQDDAEDLDTTAQTYDYNTVAISTLASAVGEVTYDDLAFTNGADMDNVTAGEMFILRIRRATGNATDTLAGDAYLHRLHLRET